MSEVKNGRHVDENGTVKWYNNGVIHREGDLPAVEYENGTKEWVIHGERHRVYGPAIITFHGENLWYQNGLPHREDGPAYETPDGYKEWWLNDVQYEEEEFHQAVEKIRLERKLGSGLEEKPETKQRKI